MGYAQMFITNLISLSFYRLAITCGFSCFIHSLATTFLELWRRKQALIVWEWDLQNIESDEENRPEFETSAKNFRTNPVTKDKEPYIPTWTKVFRYFVTASVVTMMVRGNGFFFIRFIRGRERRIVNRKIH